MFIVSGFLCARVCVCSCYFSFLICCLDRLRLLVCCCLFRLSLMVSHDRALFFFFFVFSRSCLSCLRNFGFLRSWLGLLFGIDFLKRPKFFSCFFFLSNFASFPIYLAPVVAVFVFRIIAWGAGRCWNFICWINKYESASCKKKKKLMPKFSLKKWACGLWSQSNPFRHKE